VSARVRVRLRFRRVRVRVRVRVRDGLTALTKLVTLSLNYNFLS
jgi:hypothetical protein